MPWSQYGPWIWHPQYMRYYRQRQNHLGERETQWGPDYSMTQEAPSEFPVVAANYAETEEKRPKRRRRRGKNKSNRNAAAESDSESDPEPTPDQTEEESSVEFSGDQPGHYAMHSQPQPTTYTENTIPYPTDSSQVTRPTPYVTSTSEVVHDQTNFYHDPEDEDESAYVIDSEEGSLRIDQVPIEGDVGYEGDDSSEDQRISNHEGDYEVLDPRYRVCNSNAFQPGEVFKVLWSEPIGKSATNGGSTTISDTRTFVDSYGEKFYVGFRRFIVVANDAGHCTCVPILTYGGRGCRKSGVKPDRHGIVVQVGKKPHLVKGEPELGFPTIHINIHARGERLTKESRVNYSKLVTVEHNVKVFFVGSVTNEDAELVQDAVDKCWRRKSFHRRAPNS